MSLSDYYFVPVNTHDPDDPAPLALSVNVKVFPERVPAKDEVIEFPQASVLTCEPESVFPLAVNVNVTLFPHAPPPTVPGIVTVLLLAELKVSVEVPDEHEAVPVNVPTNFAASLVSDFFVHDESITVVSEKMARNVIAILLLKVCFGYSI